RARAARPPRRGGRARARGALGRGLRRHPLLTLLVAEPHEHDGAARRRRRAHVAGAAGRDARRRRPRADRLRARAHRTREHGEQGVSRARLRAAGAVVAELHDGSGLEARLSPRPHLTAATAEGVAVTDVGPDDHAHHLGASLALADVDGTTFWGGRTFVAGSGSTWLDNHGTQEVASLEGSETALRARIDWRDRAGRRLIVEDR